ncbi:hypothetical protein RJ639_004408 [Escallonia herrerae]|uniref:Dirigent protein n=1 Tax=Escallonia herrerae TaxID=1293975 RepID=A0AA88W6L3_9ASTE|nr:hypothetical protein RJ639_004408 [Escallonia herrerae]
MGKLTTFLLFFAMLISFRVAHDKSKGKEPNCYPSGPSPNDVYITHYFGPVNMLDDPLTIAPKQTARLVGRAHGLYASYSQEEIALLYAGNFVFKDGEYNGNSLVVLGYNLIMDVYHELPITIGRLAQGAVIFETYFFNST